MGITVHLILISNFKKKLFFSIYHYSETGLQKITPIKIKISIQCKLYNTNLAAEWAMEDTVTILLSDGLSTITRTSRLVKRK